MSLKDEYCEVLECKNKMVIKIKEFIRNYSTKISQSQQYDSDYNTVADVVTDEEALGDMK